MKSSILIVGLGNVGNEYIGTRHNIGFHVVDELNNTYQSVFSYQKSCNALVSKVIISRNLSCILAKPTTYMNNSGLAVQALLKWYELSPKSCIIITDNIDLAVGMVKVKGTSKDRGNNTHNGVRSINQHLQSFPYAKEYTRMYIGVGSHRKNENLSKYVLDKWHESENTLYDTAIKTASGAIISGLESLKDEDTPINTNLASVLQSYI